MFPSTRQFLAHCKQQHSISVLLLSIRVNSVSNITLTGTIHGTNNAVRVIFIAKCSSCVTRKCSIRTLGCLVGPISTTGLFSILSGTTTHVHHSSEYLSLRYTRKLVHVPLTSVHCLSIHHGCIAIRTSQSCARGHPLNRFRTRLNSKFYRIKHTVVIGLQQVHYINESSIRLASKAAPPLPHETCRPLGQAVVSRAELHVTNSQPTKYQGTIPN